ncbi:Shiga toxin A subunit [Enterobacter oligotrophicus]|uniref:Shiga toxin A subunit n=1 Tax=Enterobacter oligotrophicus TaxID=2478464 RepID=UPI001E41FA95|nr:Shiga toxin A subunit [Enterobacter oligotrophicus]
MIRTYALAIIFMPVCVIAAVPDSECAAPEHYVEGMLLTSIKNDLGIDLTTIQHDKTAVEVLSIAPVSDVFARKLAIADSKADLKKPADIRLSERDYYRIYHDNHVLTVTAKYTFTDKNGKLDEFISSAFTNDNECSVRFNGYLTLSREF